MNDDLKRRPRLLVLSTVWVEPTSSAAGWRMKGLLDLFLTEGYDIHYASTSAQSDHALDLNRMNIMAHTVKVNDDAVDPLIQEIAPDVVLFDRFMVEEQFGWRVAKHAPEAVRILDSEDLHGLRYARQAALTDGRAFQLADLNREIMMREMAAIHRCDISLVISSFEMGLLRDHFGVSEKLLCYLPFKLEKKDLGRLAELPDYTERSDFVSIGNFRHAPNQDALHILKQKVWPIIRTEIPDAKLNIYGAYPRQHDLNLSHPESGFFVHGHVASIDQVLTSARVMLAPLRFGAGLKGKLVDAMRFGLPSVTTKIGCEGIKAAGDWPGSIQEDWESFAKAAVKLHEEETVWNDAHGMIKPIMKERFIQPGPEKAFIHSVNTLRDNLNQHRSSNWIGAMLQLNSQKSYTYLSKWIMAKQG